MPGRPGRYDLGAIAAWLDQEGLGKRARQTGQDNDNPTKRLQRLRCEREEFELARARGQYVAIDPVRRLLSRMISEAKTRLAELPDRLMAELPAELPSKEMTRIRRGLQRSVDRLCVDLSDIPAADEFNPKKKTA